MGLENDAEQGAAFLENMEESTRAGRMASCLSVGHLSAAPSILFWKARPWLKRQRLMG